MEHSERIGELAKALAAAQGQFKPIKRESVNPFFKSRYADLAAIIDGTREALSKNALAFVQTVHINGGVGVETLLMHESGEWMKGSITLKPKADDPQSIGSASTYGRRYSLAAILGVAADDDDDGNSASAATPAEAGKGRQAAETKAPEHFCKVHNTAFFKKGKMKSYAHPIAGTGDAQGKGVEWCHEHEGPRLDDPDGPEVPEPIHDAPPRSAEMSSPEQHERAVKVTALAGIKGEPVGGLNRLTWYQAELVIDGLVREMEAQA